MQMPDYLTNILDQLKTFMHHADGRSSPSSGTSKEIVVNPSKLDKGFQAPIKSSFKNSGGFDATGKGSVGKKHPAIDLRSPGGTSVYPIAPGVVTSVKIDPLGGNTVNIKHAKGYASYYAHLGTINVKQNDNVGYNTVIGTVGDSGNAKSFPHLHLQCYLNGSLIDPASLFSVPSYSNFDNKKEVLWLPGAQETAKNFKIKKTTPEISRMANEFYNNILNSIVSD